MVLFFHVIYYVTRIIDPRKDPLEFMFIRRVAASFCKLWLRVNIKIQLLINLGLQEGATALQEDKNALIKEGFTFWSFDR